ncbi:hypothetical protein, partial [Bacteroides sp. CAG:633]|uniref:hypothetical protein n=1 Tax=Bacteroides sp. CAG:633 TaxID=1262744 RepID=UPI002590A068
VSFKGYSSRCLFPLLTVLSLFLIWEYFSFFGEAVCRFPAECSKNSVFQVSQAEVSTQPVVWQ